MESLILKSNPIPIPIKKEKFVSNNFNTQSYDFKHFSYKTPDYNTPPINNLNNIKKEGLNNVEKNVYSNNRNGPNKPFGQSPPNNKPFLKNLYMDMYANMYLSNSLGKSPLNY